MPATSLTAPRNKAAVADYRFARTAALIGDAGLKAFADTSVIVFGIGGVGSWCVEALARTGIGRITIVDSDAVDITNINRQLPALTNTVGRPKVEVLARRIADINPACRVEALAARYTPESASTFGIEGYDYAVDAIDSLKDKADLILRCSNATTAPRRGFVSSMGAARKADAGAVRAADFWKAEGCPLARALRTRFRRDGLRPRFRCVYSPEPPMPQPPGPNGTFMHVTAAFGLRLAQEIIAHILTTSQDHDREYDGR